MASHKERKPHPGCGDAGIPTEGLVDLRKGPPVAGIRGLPNFGRDWVPGMYRKKDHPGRKRSSKSVSGYCRPMGSGAERPPQTGSHRALCQPEGLVAVRAGTRLSGDSGGPYHEWQRLPLLQREAGAGRIQRSGYPGTGTGPSVASRSKWGPDPGNGHGGEPPESLVDLSGGPRVESGDLLPGGAEEMRLSRMRGSGARETRNITRRGWQGGGCRWEAKAHGGAARCFLNKPDFLRS